MKERQRGGVIVGLMMILVGMGFLLSMLGKWNWNNLLPFVKYWPVVLILIGVDTLIKNTFLEKLVSVVIWVGVVYLLIQYFVFGQSFGIPRIGF